MSAILTIASLTIREAVRRRLVAAFAAITVALVSLSAWGFYRLSHNAKMTSGEIQLAHGPGGGREVPGPLQLLQAAEIFGMRRAHIQHGLEHVGHLRAPSHTSVDQACLGSVTGGEEAVLGKYLR